MQTDLPRTQLSLLVGYGNPHSAAVPRTLAGGRRRKPLFSSSTRGNCPLGTTFTASSEPILLLFVRFLGAATQQVDSTTYENPIATFTHWTAQLFSYQYIFHPSRRQVLPTSGTELSDKHSKEFCQTTAFAVPSQPISIWKLGQLPRLFCLQKQEAQHRACALPLLAMPPENHHRRVESDF